jgi:hypothetical protein
VPPPREGKRGVIPLALSRCHNEADVPRWGNRPVEPACLPELGTVEMALAAIRAWHPYDGDAWLDDMGDALDAVPPAEDRVDELAQRLRCYLMQLVSTAEPRRRTSVPRRSSRGPETCARRRCLATIRRPWPTCGGWAGP